LGCAPGAKSAIHDCPVVDDVVVLKAMTMAAVGWTVSALLSVPQLGIYSVNVVANKTVCESIFRRRPISHRQAYLTSGGC